MLKFLLCKWNKLEAASGMVSNGPGMGGSATIDGGVGAIVLGSLIGAFVGMVGGFIISHLLRFCAMLVNRPLGGYSWVIIGTFVGALAFALMAANGDKN
jgi:hypothetical protein